MLLVIWSANGDGSALTAKVSSNLLNDDTYRFICAGNCVIHPRQIEQGTHYIRKFLIYSKRKMFLEKAVVELVYKLDKKSYRECL